MVLPILGANTESAAYEISNSLRLNDDDSPYLSDTPGSAGNRRTFTISLWAKRSDLNTSAVLYGAGTAATDMFQLLMQNDGDENRIIIQNRVSGTNNLHLVTTNSFRDPSAWYHIVLAVDTTQSTSSNRAKLYVNGTQITAFGTETYPSQDYDCHVNNTVAHHIGAQSRGSANDHFDGYITELHSIDGSAKAQTDFGKFNNNGVWVPKAYTGTYGTNGFFMEFKQTGTGTNASGIGADTSGNNNHFAVNNLASTDIVTDTCTNNYATMNILTAGSDEPVMREGNLQQYAHGTSNSAGIAPTIMPDKGKWYIELYLESPSGGDYPFFGITDQRNLNQENGNGTKMAAGFEIDGATNNQSNTFLGSITNTNTGWPTFADNDIVMFALDLDNRKLWIGRQGTFMNSGNPASGSNEQLAWTNTTNVGVMMLGYDGGGGGGAQSVWNFGQDGSFAGKTTAQGNADGNSYGDFYYSPPSGYFALNTKNLAEYG